MSGSPHFRIGTRGSDLALWQAHHVRDLITAEGGTAEIIVLSTQGDREQVQSFEKLEGKGFFTKEIEEALLEGHIDIAVHSHKDLETRQPDGLTIAAIPARASARDVLLVRRESFATAPWLPLHRNAAVGTSSVRRRDQLLLLRPDLEIPALRGNVPTRIQRLREGRYDAIVLAEAGISRLELDLTDLRLVPLDPAHFVPAPAQGALALQMRAEDERCPFVRRLGQGDATRQVQVEREVLRHLDGGCQLPFGAHWDQERGQLRCFLQKASGPVRVLAADAPQALARLDQPAPRSILLTRTPRPGDVLHRLASGSGCTLIEQPLIEIRTLESPAVPDTWGITGPDWVWLGSPGAAEAAREWLQSCPHARIAVPGPGTADALDPAWMPRLAFIGQGHPRAAWKAFSTVVGEGEHVAIPHGTASMKRWLEINTAATLHAWEHYAVLPTRDAVPEAETVCFTSPSNVAAWDGPAPGRIIALGPSTATALEQKGWPHTVARTPDAFGIWEALEAQ